ncbi:hypothetical protein I317_01179 [Kwoniella heveanensis CBS 569]|nr:hypothetical protein I317_01179 [Kwoniella heveanensis CBS 569]
MSDPQCDLGIQQPYRLSCQLVPTHQSDVKAVLAISDSLIATASRDTSVGLWTKTDNLDQFELKALLEGHHAYVNSLAYIPAEKPDADGELTSKGNHTYESEIIASGGNSGLILLHSLRTFDPTSCGRLSGHGLNVCTLAYSRKLKKLISGSWDHTARVWSRKEGRWNSDLLLEGHEEAVWGVAIVDAGPREGCFLTADNMINLWDAEGNLLKRLKGSPAPVRSLAVMPDCETFVSACNDNLIRMWNFDGEVLRRLYAHTDYVYQVTLSNADMDLLLSCSEDHSARLWKDGQVIAKLLHPCQTVWSVSSMPNGDIVTGGSDGCVRIWSRDESRHATQEKQDMYTSAVEKAMKDYNDNLNTQSQTRNRDASTISIDIDLSDDDPPIPLVLRVGADPRQVAEDFGRQHRLSENYINQIEAFIIANLAACR